MSELQKQIDRRRTFAIISHPDAGKTTLTEKLLLFGSAIQMAGAVKLKRASYTQLTVAPIAGMETDLADIRPFRSRPAR